MTNFVKLILYILIIIASIAPAFATEIETIRTDETAHIAIDAQTNIDSALRMGIYSFVFNLEKRNNLFKFATNPGKDELSKQLSALKRYAQNPSSKQCNILLTGSSEQEAIMQFLINELGETINFSSAPGDSQVNEGVSKIICYTPDRLACISDSSYINETYREKFLSNPDGKMIFWDASATCIDSLRNFSVKNWRLTGRIPNFILVSEHNIREAQKHIDWLNNLRRFRGEIKYNDKLLHEIYWKQLPGTVTPGRFSFPLLDYSLVLSPYKNGYRITPGEIIHHTGMKDAVRPFIAYNTHYNDGLSYCFNFNKNTRNEVEPQNKTGIVNEVKWAKDKERREVACFETENSFIDYTKPNGLNFNTPISVSVWLKPEKLNDYMGIIGIGTSFSMKLKDGHPDFTTAQIKDHIAQTQLKKNIWTHVGLVFNPGGAIDFFINGEKTASMQASDIQDSKQSLVIGNNIWGEQYYGYMDKLMIWDRGLSENEFRELYQNQLHPATANFLWFLIFVPFLSLVSFLTYRKLKKKEARQPAKKSIPPQNSIKQEVQSTGNSIEIFGHFNIKSSENGNLTKNFSPLLKQLLSFFILKTVFSSEKGVSTKEISDTFWPGFTKEQAKDNRGTNIKKLRKLLELLPGAEIIFKDKKWFLQTTLDTSVDLFQYATFKNQLTRQLEKGHTDKELINHFLCILRPGNILKELDYEWLDAYKTRLTEEVPDFLHQIIKKLPPSDPFKIDIAKTVLIFDDLNEEALIILVQNLSKTGNHVQAKQFFDEFSKRYKLLYAEPFNLDFNELIRQKKY